MANAPLTRPLVLIGVNPGSWGSLPTDFGLGDVGAAGGVVKYYIL